LIFSPRPETRGLKPDAADRRQPGGGVSVLLGSVEVGSVGSLLGEVLSGVDGDDGGRLESGVPGVLLAGSEADGSELDGSELEGVLEELLDELLELDSPDVASSVAGSEVAVPVLPLLSEEPEAEAERERSQ
jgi:hypothetical protein